MRKLAKIPLIVFRLLKRLLIYYTKISIMFDINKLSNDYINKKKIPLVKCKKLGNF